jgi:hypothetical protein
MHFILAINLQFCEVLKPSEKQGNPGLAGRVWQQITGQSILKAQFCHQCADRIADEHAQVLRRCGNFIEQSSPPINDGNHPEYVSPLFRRD